MEAGVAPGQSEQSYSAMFFQPIAGPNRLALWAWIKEHRPDLAAQIGQMSLKRSRAVLNAATGLEVLGTDTIEGGSAKFLAALQSQQISQSQHPG